MERVRKRPNLIGAETIEKISVVTSSEKDKTDSRKVRAIRKFESEPAYVRINTGMTKNLGNYESLRIDVSLTVPCYPEEIEQVFDKVSDDVAALLAREMQKYEL